MSVPPCPFRKASAKRTSAAPPLYIPEIPSSIPLEFTSSDRNVQVMRWESDEHDETDKQLEVLAGEFSTPNLQIWSCSEVKHLVTGTCTSPNLRFSTLRTLLSLLLAIPSGAFRFGRLSNAEVSGGSHYGIEQIHEPLEKDAAHQQSDLVPSGFFILLQPGPSLVPVQRLGPH